MTLQVIAFGILIASSIIGWSLAGFWHKMASQARFYVWCTDEDVRIWREEAQTLAALVDDLESKISNGG